MDYHQGTTMQRNEQRDHDGTTYKGGSERRPCLDHCHTVIHLNIASDIFSTTARLYFSCYLQVPVLPMTARAIVRPSFCQRRRSPPLTLPDGRGETVEAGVLRLH